MATQKFRKLQRKVQVLQAAPMNYKLIDGKAIWEMHATHGLPIEISIPMAASMSYMPTWLDILCAASDDGAKWGILIPRLKDCAMDAYESDVAKEICKKLNSILEMSQSVSVHQNNPCRLFLS